MELTKTATEFKELVKKTMNVCKSKIGELAFDSDMDESDNIEMFGFMKDVFKLCDVSVKLVVEQSEAIDAINKKLDKLLEKE